MTPDQAVWPDTINEGAKKMQANGFIAISMVCAKAKMQTYEAVVPALGAKKSDGTPVLMFFGQQAENEDTGVAAYIIVEQTQDVIDLTMWDSNDTSKPANERFLHWNIVRA